MLTLKLWRIGHGGIGFETTRLLAEHGARVYIAGRSEARVNEAISRMKSSKSSLDVRFLEFDLQDLESIKAATTEFMQKESRLDILINNAGVCYDVTSHAAPQLHPYKILSV